MYGDGLHQRDWLHVEDHCSAIEIVLEKGSVGEIYNVGAGNETKNIDLVEALLSIFRLDGDSIEYVEDRPGHDRRYSVDISKISQLGWVKKHSIKTGLNETVNWYKDNPWWWKPLRSRNRD